MCGIGAVIGFEASGHDPVALAEGLVACLAHRGPDASRVQVAASGVVLAHARLSIIDLSAAGTQPLGNEDGTVWVVCNGEIYNHEALREELIVRGHRFSSRSDSEVLVHLWEEYGRRMLDRLSGMFAFVLVDARSGDILVARDRLGKKPVVYAATAHGVAIASEIPALRGIPGIDWSTDPEAVALYLLRNLRHIPDPWTMYRGVRRLPPGHAMLIRGGRIVEQWRYWHPVFAPRAMSPDDLLAQFDAAVRARMVADVEIGALLSGGVDSTAIIDSMRRQGATEIRTYALGRDADDEELVRARRMAEKFGTRHTEVWFDADRHHDHLELMLRRHGEPIMLLPLGHAYELFTHIRDDGLRVVMTGHGADEVFYGYDGHRRTATLTNLLRAMPAIAAPLAGTAAGLFRRGPPRARRSSWQAHRPGTARRGSTPMNWSRSSARCSRAMPRVRQRSLTLMAGSAPGSIRAAYRRPTWTRPRFSASSTRTRTRSRLPVTFLQWRHRSRCGARSSTPDSWSAGCRCLTPRRWAPAFGQRRPS